MNTRELQEIFTEISQQPYLKASQLPQLNLYIDQILTLFSTGTAEEQALTKAMVNNYSKEKMLRPIKGKKYSREQVLQILLICRLKSVLTMEEIKALTVVLMDSGREEAALEEILCSADQKRSHVFHTAQHWLEAEEQQEEMTMEKKVALVLELSSLSQLFAEAARKITQNEFT